MEEGAAHTWKFSKRRHIFPLKALIAVNRDGMKEKVAELHAVNEDGPKKKREARLAKQLPRHTKLTGFAVHSCQ
jgi:hypothetical protein